MGCVLLASAIARCLRWRGSNWPLTFKTIRTCQPAVGFGARTQPQLSVTSGGRGYQMRRQNFWLALPTSINQATIMPGKLIRLSKVLPPFFPSIHWRGSFHGRFHPDELTVINKFQQSMLENRSSLEARARRGTSLLTMTIC